MPEAALGTSLASDGHSEPDQAFDTRRVVIAMTFRILAESAYCPTPMESVRRRASGVEVGSPDPTSGDCRSMPCSPVEGNVWSQLVCDYSATLLTEP